MSLIETTTSPSGAGQWLSIAQLAAAQSVSKQAVTKRVNKLRSQGLLDVRVGPKGAIHVDAAEFDHAVASYGNELKRQAGSGGKPQPAPVAREAELAPPQQRLPAYHARAAPIQSTDEAPVLALEQARRARAEAALKELQLAEKQSLVTSVAEVRAAATEATAALKNALSQSAVAAAEAIGNEFRIDERLVRARLRVLERNALAAFVAALAAYSDG